MIYDFHIKFHSTQSVHKPYSTDYMRLSLLAIREITMFCKLKIPGSNIEIGR